MTEINEEKHEIVVPDEGEHKGKKMIKYTKTLKGNVIAGGRVAGSNESFNEWIATPEEVEQSLEERQKTVNNLIVQLENAQAKREKLGEAVKLTPQQTRLKKDFAKIDAFLKQQAADRDVDLKKNAYDQETEKINTLKKLVDEARK